jgi:hypothetical protein
MHAHHGICVEAKSQFSPSVTWVPGMKLRSSGLAASTFTHWTISPLLFASDLSVCLVKENTVSHSNPKAGGKGSVNVLVRIQRGG